MKTFKILMLLLLISIFSIESQIAWAAADQQQNMVDIQFPEGTKIEKKSDITANMLSRMFGASFNFVTGISPASDPNSESSGGLGFYSGLIVSMLAILNLAAMAFVATSIIYMWGIFAVTTAHEGKKLGGSMYNSLWVPVRHAMSFTLVVPVLNGLSLMQVAILCCIGLSINFANVIWDSAGKYLIEYAHSGVIDSSTGASEAEAWAAIPVMFSGLVIQDAVYSEKNQWADFTPRNDNKVTSFIASPLKTYNGEKKYTPQNLKEPYYHQDPNGKYIITKDHKNGSLTVTLRAPMSVSDWDISKFTLSMPKKEDIDKEDGMTAQMYEYKMKLADIRAGAIITLFECIRNNSWQYLGSQEATGSSMYVIEPKNNNGKIFDLKNNPDLRGIEVETSVNLYREGINSASRPIIEKIIAIEKENVDSPIAKSIDTAIDGGENGSVNGWASAGLFSFTLAALQQRLDNAFMESMSIDKKDAGYTMTQNVWSNNGVLENLTQRMKNIWGNGKFSLAKTSQDAIQRSPEYCSLYLMRNSHLAGAASTDSTTDNKVYEVIVDSISRYFLQTSAVKTDADTSYGILGKLLNEFKSYDPIVVIQKFGDSFLSMGWNCVKIGIALWGGGVSVVSYYAPGAGVALMTVGLSCVLIGIMFAYIVPITPVVFWLRALASWLFMVIEAMVAAPFWVCAHALPEGTGFAGQHAKRGYMMLLQIVIYPALLVIGAVFAIAMVQSLGYLFTTLLDLWFTKASRTYITIGFFADMTFAIILCSIMYYLSFTIFTKGINYLPERVLRWCGGGDSMGLQENDGNTARTIVMAGGVFNSTAKTAHGEITRGMDKLSAWQKNKDEKSKNNGNNGTPQQMTAKP